MINKLKTRWGAFAWLHLVPESIRSRYHDALAENIALHHRCDELQTAADLWEEAYSAMRTAYVMLKDEKGAR